MVNPPVNGPFCVAGSLLPASLLLDELDPLPLAVSEVVGAASGVAEVDSVAEVDWSSAARTSAAAVVGAGPAFVAATTVVAGSCPAAEDVDETIRAAARDVAVTPSEVRADVTAPSVELELRSF